jgi:hypothetical protein
MRRFLGLSACFLTLAGCLSGTQSLDFDGSSDGRQFLMNLAWDQMSVICSDPSTCPATVGMLLSRMTQPEPGTASCTTFLVNGQTLVTDSHCVPVEIRQAGASCKGKIKALFPDTATLKGESVECESVVTATAIVEDKNSPEYVRRPDYAVLRLARTVSRGSLALSPLGLPDGIQLTMFAVDPDIASNISVLTSKQCTIQRSTTVFPSEDPLFGLVFLANCDAIAGNSGSPLVDNEKKVRAVVYAGRKDSDLPLLSPRFAGMLGASIDDLMPFAFANNAACISLDGGPLPPNIAERCTKTVLGNERFHEMYAESDHQVLKNLVGDWIAANSFYFKYKAREIVPKDDPKLYVEIPAIDCIRDPSGWPFEDSGSASTFQTTYQAPVYMYKLTTKGFQLQLVPAHDLDVSMQVQFERDEFQKTGQATTTITEIIPGKNRSPFVTHQTVKKCQ